ncbi:MAG: hypothetical protein H0T93_02935, partial [Chloroflexia bacterium]|nr:hypothetical protein [Chloroflexia bacterium]
MDQTVPSPSGTPARSRVLIGVPKETVAGETRVSLIPETITRLVSAGMDVYVEAGAGEGSSISDDDYITAGATVVADAAALYNKANLVIKVQAPSYGDASSS